MTRRPIIATLGLAAALGLAACSGSAATGAPTDAPTATQAPAPSSAAAGVCAASTEAATVDVTIEGFAFSPSSVAAKVGDVIGFTNEDSASHTATLDDDACTTEGIGKGATGALVFSAPGSYPFHCRIHPDMTGTFEISG